MRDPELVARAGNAAARLEQAWERWRVLHGLDGSADPLASYVGYSHKEPMGQPRVVIGVNAAEAEFFADFLESHDCARPGGPLGADPGAGLPAADTGPVTGEDHLAVNGNSHASDSGVLYPPVSGPQPVMANGSHPSATPQDPPDVMAAELAGWASGELPGQASEQMASWAAADGPGAKALNQSRSAR